jgi:hypothetical protein
MDGGKRGRSSRLVPIQLVVSTIPTGLLPSKSSERPEKRKRTEKKRPGKKRPGGEPLTFTIGVPTNPTSNGSVFNLRYEEKGGGNIREIDGTGTIHNGVASGTWVCDASTPVCSPVTGTFTAVHQVLSAC